MKSTSPVQFAYRFSKIHTSSVAIVVKSFLISVSRSALGEVIAESLSPSAQQQVCQSLTRFLNSRITFFDGLMRG